jgi:hypothetical protein
LSGFVPFHERPSLGQLAAMAAAGNAWACPRCGCCDWRVASSYLRADGIRRRQRVCRNCGHALPTYETPVKPEPESRDHPPAVSQAAPIAAAGDDGLPAGIVLEPEPPAPDLSREKAPARKGKRTPKRSV